jgi:hypothetical protein
MTRGHGSPEFEFRIYWKPGNAYSYLPYGSYSTRHVLRGWLKADARMQRLLTQSSNPLVWLEDEHLQNRGYPVKAIDATFSSINWNQRQKILGLKMPAEGTNDTFFAAYSGCVFSNRNAPGTDQLRGFMNLSLIEMRTQEDGQESRDIFPPVPSSRTGAPSRWDVFYGGNACDLNRAAH